MITAQNIIAFFTIVWVLWNAYLCIRVTSVFKFRREVMADDGLEFLLMPSFNIMLYDYFEWDFSKYRTGGIKFLPQKEKV